MQTIQLRDLPHRREVYRSPVNPVNLRICNPRRFLGIGAVLTLGISHFGCATPTIDRAYYPIGIWYDVATVPVGAGGSVVRALNNDFRTIRTLGFNTVFIRGAETLSRSEVIQLARSHDLRVAMADNDAEQYVRSGVIPAGRRSVRSLAAQVGRTRADIVHLGEITDRRSAERVREIAQWLDSLSRPVRTHVSVRQDVQELPGDLGVALVSSTSPPEEHGEFKQSRPKGSLATISTARGAGEDRQVPRRWLGILHTALAGGQTEGVLFDSYRRADGGIVGANNRTPSRRAFAVKQVTTRARNWGSKLRGLDAKRVFPVQQSSEDLGVILFAGAKRRYLLVLNPSTERFVRSPAIIDATFDGRMINRLVGVTAGAGEVVGAVIVARQGILTVRTHLGPGEARLFEVF